MNNLEEALKKALANTFALYTKIHIAHWNVEGQNFHEYHKFLDDFYNEVWEAVDAIAEHIRTLDIYAPTSMSEFLELSDIDAQMMVQRASQMLEELLHDNNTVIDSLETAYKYAGAHLGLQNFLQDRIDAHEKWGWMLRATLKRTK